MVRNHSSDQDGIWTSSPMTVIFLPSLVLTIFGILADNHFLWYLVRLWWDACTWWERECLVLVARDYLGTGKGLPCTWLPCTWRHSWLFAHNGFKLVVCAGRCQVGCLCSSWLFAHNSCKLPVCTHGFKSVVCTRQDQVGCLC